MCFEPGYVHAVYGCMPSDSQFLYSFCAGCERRLYFTLIRRTDSSVSSGERLISFFELV